MRKQLKTTSSVLLIMVFVATLLVAPIVQADRFDDQINALNQENSVKKAQNNQLGSEATSLADTISKLQAEINVMQAKINTNKQKVAELKVEIAKAEAELDKQRATLGEIIKSLYIDGDVSTLEMLASSKDLSDFFDKQQYKESVQSKVKTTLDRVQQLKLDLNTQKESIEKITLEQQALQNQIVAQRAENDRLLGLNQAQQDSLNAQIKENSAKASQLRSQQAAENARLLGAMVQQLLLGQMVVIPIHLFGVILHKIHCLITGVCITVNVLAIQRGKCMRAEATCRIGVVEETPTSGMITQERRGYL